MICDPPRQAVTAIRVKRFGCYALIGYSVSCINYEVFRVYSVYLLIFRLIQKYFHDHFVFIYFEVMTFLRMKRPLFTSIQNELVLSGHDSVLERRQEENNSGRKKSILLNLHFS